MAALIHIHIKHSSHSHFCAYGEFPALYLEHRDLAHGMDVAVIDAEFFSQVILVVGEEEYAFIHGRKGFQGSGLDLNAQKRLKLPYERRIMR